MKQSRQQEQGTKVATTPGCRDVRCKDQRVATSSRGHDIKYKEKKGRDKIKLSRHQLHLRRVATRQSLCDITEDNSRSRQELDVVIVSTSWAI